MKADLHPSREGPVAASEADSLGDGEMCSVILNGFRVALSEDEGEDREDEV